MHLQAARPARWRRWLLRPLGILALAYGMVVVAMVSMENRLLFFPSKYPVGDWQPAGLPVEDASFPAADGTQLHGWYLPHEQPRAVVLLSHGNGGNITHRAEILHTLHRMGVSILAYDYRGYGRSEGSPTEQGVLQDARAARAWLSQRAGVEESAIVQLGESLGGGVAVDLAARDGAGGLILLSTFSSLPDVASHHYSWLPVRWLMRSRLDSASLIGQYQGPLLQVHGDADRVVPFASGQKLFAAANQPKEFVTLTGHDHNDPLPEEAWVAMDRFLDSIARGDERLTHEKARGLDPQIGR